MEREKEFSKEPSYIERLKNLTIEELIDYKKFLLEDYNKIDKNIHIVNTILDEYGVEQEEL